MPWARKRQTRHSSALRGRATHLLDACAKPTLNALTIIPACGINHIDALLMGQRRHAAVNNEGSCAEQGGRGGTRVAYTVEDMIWRGDSEVVVFKRMTERESYHP